jgi:acetylornithine/N-succinyldiaminopimelate aminotransferase
MSTAAVIEAFSRYVVPTYGRFPIAFTRGSGTRLWDAENKEYLDFGAGIAVTTLGHSHPALAKAIASQANTLIHTSNLYHTESQAALAKKIVELIEPGKCFFCNSGAEANEALYKLARKVGHDSGRFEILTTLNSFHGRTLAGIAATGQDKVKKGFEPAVEGFRHVPFNDLNAMRQAVSEKTIAILIEGVQGESGIQPASIDYLKGLRQLCDERKLLLFMDSVQCGMFRTGRFQSFQRILEPNASGFVPDAISMAKGLAGGLPMGAVWIRQTYSDTLGAGTHGTTFGGTPLACAAALTVFDVIERENLADRARKFGEYLKTSIQNLKSPAIQEVRGLGLMIGIELKPNISSLTVEGKTPAVLFVNRLHEKGLLTIPAGNQTIRLLPPLNISQADCDEALQKLSEALNDLN